MSKNPTLRSKLRDMLGQSFVPELRRRGFTGPEKISGNAVIHEFKRISGSQNERLSIQFDKYQRPRFILNISIEPAEGWDTFLQKGGEILSGRIAPGRGIGTGAWFRADQPWWRRLVGRPPTRETEAVEDALRCLDAIDDWFRNPRMTKVVYFSPYKLLGTETEEFKRREAQFGRSRKQ